MPPEESLQLTMATLDYWDAILESGMAVGGSLVEGGGGGGVIDVDSLEERMAILSKAPNAGFVRYEVNGLTALEETEKVVRRQLEAQEKNGHFLASYRRTNVS